jgi:hypothetical protein
MSFLSSIYGRLKYGSVPCAGRAVSGPIQKRSVAKGRAMMFLQKSVFRGATKTLLLVASIPLPLSFLTGCPHKIVLAADQPVAVQLLGENPQTLMYSQTGGRKCLSF